MSLKVEALGKLFRTRRKGAVVERFAIGISRSDSTLSCISIGGVKRPVGGWRCYAHRPIHNGRAVDALYTCFWAMWGMKEVKNGG